MSNESGQDQVYVRPYPGPGAPMAVSIEGGIEPVWSRTGTALYYRRDDRMMAVSVDTGGRFAASRDLSRQPYALSPIGRGNPNYDVADDDRFLMVRNMTGTSGPSPIHVVLNFVEELRAKVGN